MTWVLLVNSVNLTSKMYLPDTGGSFSYDLATRSPGSMRVLVYDITALSGIAIGHPVAVTYIGTSVLAMQGEIIEINATGFSDIDLGDIYELVIEDSNALPAQVLVTATYATGQTVKQILQALVADPLGTCGITLDAGQANGPALTSDMVVVDAYAIDVLNRIQTLTGWVWRIDGSKQLLMIAPGSVSSGIVLEDTVGTVIGKVAVRNARTAGYANTIILQYGTGQQSESEDFVASGASEPDDTERYTTVYPASSNINDPWPNLLIFDGVVVQPVSWGDQLGPGTWRWDWDTQTLSADQTLLGITPAGTVITVAYTAQFPARIERSDSGAISADGHPVERLFAGGEFDAITDVSAATDLADALLRRALASVDTTVTVTHRDGLAFHGETIDLDFAERGIAGTFMVVSLQATDDVDGELIYTHSLIAGDEQPDTWLDVFREVGGGGAVGGGVSGGSVSSAPAVWVDPDFDAAIFSADTGANWTLASGDREAFSYLYQTDGPVLELTFELKTTSVTGTPGYLKIAIPGARTVRHTTREAIGYMTDNGVVSSGMAVAVLGDAFLRIYRRDLANFTASTNNSDVRGTIRIPIDV